MNLPTKERQVPMHETRKKLAIFDMDGTVVEFTLDFTAARSEVIRYFVNIGVPESAMNKNSLILQIVATAKLHVEARKIDPVRWHEIQGDIKAIIHRHEVLASASTRPMPGIESVLSGLERAGIYMAICSLNTSATVQDVLERFGLSRYFKVIAGRDSVHENKFKPHPDHGLHITTSLGIYPSDTVVIGDHPNDVEMARAMGAAGIAITSKRHPAADFGHVRGITLVSDDDYAILASTILNMLGIDERTSCQNRNIA